MENKFIRLNIAFKPPEIIATKAIALSKKLSRESEPHFVLDGVSVYPHITVYAPEFPEKNLDKILAAARNIAETTKKIKMSGDQFKANQGFVGIKFALTDEIKKFHEKVVALLNPLREDHNRVKCEAADYKMKLSPKKMENNKKYGYPDALELYNPHLTIIRLADEKQAQAICKNIKWDIPEFEIDELGVYKMGKHGTCRELAGKFELTGF
jgi:2'-5' RNA ligase